MKTLKHIVAAVMAILLISGCVRSMREYRPEVFVSEDSICKYYRFSETQLAHMRATPLDHGRFSRYIHAKWPLSKIRRFCTPENRWPEGYQNLVGNHIYESTLHTNINHDFDTIYVYVCEDKGTHTYSDGVRKRWTRWDYSLNFQISNDWWVVIESLPNDFMDEEEDWRTTP